jgi:hypothetical protein
MDNEKEKQMDMDVIDAPEEEMEHEHRTEEIMSKRAAPAETMDEELEALFDESEAENFRTQWLNIQSKFVDNPRESVREADELVASVLKSVTMGFHNRRSSLEKQWNSGNKVSTEDLRVALKRYRSFFDRLLTLES